MSCSHHLDFILVLVRMFQLRFAMLAAVVMAAGFPVFGWRRCCYGVSLVLGELQLGLVMRIGWLTVQ